jgi:diguanylate cyclase (GGDEF)-like protein/PAS domain S-box-containing protein
VNGRVAEIAGRAHEELVGERASDVLVAIDGRPALRAWRAQPSDGRLERHEVELRRADGAAVWIEGGGMPYRDAAGRTVGTIGVVADISARKALETELSRQAFEDPLTGLGNRGRFRARADHALKVLRSPDARRPAVLLVDLDEFKTVNDSLGPAAGDRLLTMVAARLLDATRGSDTVARLGGDEFAALLGGVRDEAEAVVVAQRILAALATPFDLDGRDTYLTASVGIAVAHDADGADDLLRNADLALYRAKQLGKGRCERFVPAMHTAAIERLALATELRRAVDEHQLTLHYQPILELCSGRTVGVEALVRWRHPERGLMPPLSFIPLAESTGIILPLGRWVLRQACREASGWAAAPGHPAGHVPPVAVNISARQLERPDFVDEVTEALGDSGLAPERLVLEVTESILLADLGSAITRLEALRAVGVRVALDDFGTGYSSLAYLQRLPVDLLKIDRSFTADVTAGGKRAALARIILSLAETLGIRTVAEGVETAEQHAELATLGCHLGQGYLYARPLTATALTTFLSTPAAARGDP